MQLRPSLMRYDPVLRALSSADEVGCAGLDSDLRDELVFAPGPVHFHHNTPPSCSW